MHKTNVFFMHSFIQFSSGRGGGGGGGIFLAVIGTTTPPRLIGRFT